MNLVGLKDSNALITVEKVHDFMKDADEAHDREARLCD